MINSKYYTRILAVLLVCAVAFSIVLRYFPGFIPITSANNVSFDYETKLFDKNSVMEIDIQVDPDQWNELIENATDKEYIPCDIVINGEKFSQVGIRAKGNTSLSTVASDSTTDRYSFKVEFDHYVDGQTCYGLDKLALNNNIQDTTYMKEYMSYDLLSYMGIPCSLYSFSNITVNGEPWGFYLALEVPEESFAARNFGNSYGDLYKPESTKGGGGAGGGFQKDENGQNFKRGMNGQTNENADGQQMPSINKENGMGGGMMGSGTGCDLAYTGDDLDNYSSIWDSSVFDTSKKDHKRVVEALQNISEGNLEGYLDVDTMLKYIAVNSVIVNYDSYFGSLQHNYYLYENNGELSMLPWDYNLAFAGFQSNNSTSAVNDPIDTPVSGTTLEARPLIGQVLESDDNMEQYHEYLNQIIEQYFNSGYWEETIDRVDALISDYVKNDVSAFVTYDEYKKGVETLKEFGLLRAESITGQLDGTIPSTREGQSGDTSTLIDASSVSITDMGTQGGGMMGKGDKQNGADGQNPPELPVDGADGQNHLEPPANGVDGQTRPESPTNDENLQAPPETIGDGDAAQVKDPMSRPKDKNEMLQDTSIDSKTLIINLTCIIVAAAALFAVKHYRRRKVS